MKKQNLFILLMVVLIVLAIAGCYRYYNAKSSVDNAYSQSNVSRADSSGRSVMPAKFSHEVVVVLENESYDKVIGNAEMPYLNELAAQYGVAENFYANTHPSIGNYFMLTTGQVITNDDGYSGTVSDDNIVRAMGKYGKVWRVYAEGITETGYLEGDTKTYMKRHNPFAYFSDVKENEDEASNIVPFMEFNNDFMSGALPDFSFVVPNNCNSAHDCPLGLADLWLQNYLSPLVEDADFQKDGLLVIMFDEGGEGDNANGGGRIPVILVSSQVKSSYKSNVFYQHQNLLRTLLYGIGVNAYPGASADARSMSDMFKE